MSKLIQLAKRIVNIIKSKNKKKLIVIGGCLVFLVMAVSGFYLYQRNLVQAEITSGTISKNSTVSDVKFDSKKINIYLFWGQGCPHCAAMYNFFDDIQAKYSKYYNFYGFEVWYNDDNASLMQKVADKLSYSGDNGIPFLIIGDKVFVGYNEKMNGEIESVIVEQYDKTNRYDVIKELEN